MTPSVKTIVKQLGSILAHEYGEASIKPIALKIRAAIENAHTHEQVDKALDSINQLLHGYGVEAIRGKFIDNYYQDINLLYVNLGDTYIPTIIYDTKKERFLVCSWGDIVESQPKQFDL